MAIISQTLAFRSGNALTALKKVTICGGAASRAISTRNLHITSASAPTVATSGVWGQCTKPAAINPSIMIRPVQRAFGTSSVDTWGMNQSGGRSLPTNTIIKFVPQQEAWIVERMGKFHRILEPGLAILVPILDRISYVKGLKEVAVEIPSQSAITQDNVTLQLDGVLYYMITDPYKASYGVEDADFAVAQLAQTAMRAEIGQMTLDRTLAERTRINTNIVQVMNAAAENWGIKCLRYEIRDIHPPENVVAAMHQQVSAERKKRAEILESEGSRQAAINVAEGHKQSVILESEAVQAKQINHAKGEAEAIWMRADASARAIARTAQVIQSNGGHDAVALSVAEQYIDAFGQIAKEGTTVVVPANVADAAGMVTQLLTVFDKVKKTPAVSGSELRN
ncbi:hypothetical protein BASA50_003987 [Batrachochytrium salamandrivorans]|uniref:Band 7 domain-containing protein n=1 Tax=Batrachochytrium salamandrivorans TaxID=1357716 RepID=A0ABQ8FJT7_9FUNG|nr:hypothetical protein BASA61_004467 [Batrachochytrium salamandrivorans]KAH6598106.1 hypothetical protein BASA50_003987 [Batrachochytrium salamandrivorans]KAH9249014.1 hypothetical protein BASA81_013311 [Batrachochytrium salamandrivorans]KAH9272461.1 hypothetical protein BASA83_005268 [Batrachochytrium salamandrivorans]